MKELNKNLKLLFQSILTTLIILSCNTKKIEINNENGAVSSTSNIASQVGIDFLKKGGNAFDAIVATGFTLAVTSPSNGNIGGGGFLVAQTEDGRVVSLDFREKAPEKSYETMFLDENNEYSRELALMSHKSSGVPGTVNGLIKIFEDYGSGKFSLEEILAPAIYYAENGHKINRNSANGFDMYKADFLNDYGSRTIFIKDYNAEIQSLEKDYKDGTIPLDEYLDKLRSIDQWQEGDILVQSDLANTLRRIANYGIDGFYKGKTAELIVTEMEKNNGLISLDDLKKYDSVYRKPLFGTYRGKKIISMGPPSSGGALLIQMLNMLENYDIKNMKRNSVEFVHLMTEVQRLAYADRAIHLGDPDFYPSPIPMLISKEYANDRLKLVNMEKATPSVNIAAGVVVNESTETTHYSVMDKYGNAVGITTTINLSFGNKKIVDGAGFFLNNEMDDFSSKPGQLNAFGLVGDKANAIEPFKRPLSSMTPTLVLNEDNTPIMTIGAAGGSRIITAVLQVIISTIDHQIGIQEAINLGRTHSQWIPDIIRYEGGNRPEYRLPSLSKKEVESLKKLDHKFEENGNVENGKYYLARTHGIEFKNGKFYTGVDWRGNGNVSDGITY